MNNQPDETDAEREIFLAALEHAPEQRAAFLDQACANTPAIRASVETLLKHYAEDDFMQLPGANALRSPGPQILGARIGRYKLLQQIGEGGCGVVYLAEQEEPVRRHVALKVIKLGMDTRNVIARFEVERQALAMMDHPNIARVLDAGATDTGRPYFVMEWVRGIRITDYCDENKLSTPERLQLFIQVCQAIQHAHQKGVIHRDIKPSNILVTLHDGAPVPKVIDFGIAKATQGRLTDKTVFTAFEQFIGTPAYMSPEQAEMTELDIDTRSDIYSLGVLLYELLIGQTPFDGKELLQAGLDAMRRTIREQEPQRPSTKLSTMLAGDLTTTANRRQTQPPKLIHAVRGDLDWIVMKALEKDRARRYETANGLAADLKRHLDSEPVAARPPSALYRFQKLARRYKAAFAVATLMTVVLVAATGMSAWQAVQATRAKAQAKERLAESESISTFLTEIFQSPDPRRDGRTITVAEMLDKSAKKLSQGLTNQPDRKAELELTLADTYLALGLRREAVPLAEAARDFMLAAKGPDNPDTMRATLVLGVAYNGVGRYAEAIKLEAATLDRSRKAYGPEHTQTIRAMRILGISFSDSGMWLEAIKLREVILKLSRKVYGPESPDTIDAMINLGHSYIDLKRYAESIKLEEEALALSRKINGPEHPETLGVMNDLAFTYGNVGRPEEALKLAKEALALSQKINGPEHPATITAMNSLGNAYLAAGRRAEAIALQEETLALNQKVNGPGHRGTLAAINNLANTYAVSGQWSHAVVGFSNLVASTPGEHWWRHSFALLLAQTGDLEGYRRNCAQALNRFGSSTNPVIAWRMAGDCLILPGDPETLAGAAKLADVAVKYGQGHQDFAWFEFVEGLAEYRQGHFAAAADWMNKVLGDKTAADGGDADAIVDSLHAEADLVLAMAQRQLGQTAESRAVFAKGAAIIATKLPKLESGDLGDYWMGWVTDHALLKEAQALIGPENPH